MSCNNNSIILTHVKLDQKMEVDYIKYLIFEYLIDFVIDTSRLNLNEPELSYEEQIQHEEQIQYDEWNEIFDEYFNNNGLGRFSNVENFLSGNVINSNCFFALYINCLQVSNVLGE